jgi:hypothetical protein
MALQPNSLPLYGVIDKFDSIIDWLNSGSMEAP